MYDFKFADIGDGIEEGKILEWKFKVGDKVKEGDTLVIVETDKVNAELPSPVDGVITVIGKQEGEMILVGETVVVIDDGTGGAAPAPVAQAPAQKVEVAQAATSGVKATYDFKFADIGDGIEEGKILEWKFKAGDKVNEGDTLVIVETDKVNAELPSPVNGTIVSIGKQEGEMIKVGETVVLLDDGSGNYIGGTAAATEEVVEQSVIGELVSSSDMIESSSEAGSAPVAKAAGTKALATPVARNLAKNLNVNINEVTGTGPNGRVMKADIEKFAQGGAKAAPVAQTQTATAPATPKANVSRQGDVRIEKISSVRKSISQAMTTSKTIIPETVLMDDVIIDELVEMRKRAKPLAEKQGVNLTYMAFISKAVLIALKEFEVFNASFDHDNNEVIYKNFVNLGFAVDTPAGLMVPNIKDADTLSVLELAKQIRELADKSIERKVQLSDIQNGTFTITNFGSAGISYGTPVINYPELAILGVGKISKKPVVVGDEIKIATVLPLSIAVDHRIIDGADAGRFLHRVKELLGNPELMLLS